MNPQTLGTRISIVEHDVARLDRDTFGDFGVEKRVGSLERRVDVLGARIAVYASLGSIVGGAVVAFLLRVAFPS